MGEGKGEKVKERGLTGLRDSQKERGDSKRGDSSGANAKTGSALDL